MNARERNDFLERLLAANKPLIRRMIFKFRHLVTNEEAYQEFLIGANKAIDSWREEGDLEGWARCIAIYRVRNMWKLTKQAEFERSARLESDMQPQDGEGRAWEFPGETLPVSEVIVAEENVKEFCGSVRKASRGRSLAKLAETLSTGEYEGKAISCTCSGKHSNSNDVGRALGISGAAVDLSMQRLRHHALETGFAHA